MAIADVTVLGAGAFGLSVAWACARRGARVQVIDPAGPGAGASGGLVGALAPHAPDQWDEAKAFQFRALAMAETFWAGVAAAGGGDPGYARLGRLQPLADQAAVDRAGARASAAGDLWPGFRWEVTGEPGAFAPVSPAGLWIRDTLSARLNPRRAVAALVAAIRAAGGTVGSDGSPAGRIVRATGAAGLVAAGLGQGIKGQAALLRFDAGAVPQIYAGGVHVVPHDDGTVAIGSTTERDFSDPSATDDRLDAVIAAARAAVPALGSAPVVARWAGLRPRAAGRLPLLGQDPANPGAFIANGGFKTGFGLAPLAGEVMADLLLDDSDRGIPAGFRP